MPALFGRLALAIAAVVLWTTCGADPARAHDGRVDLPVAPLAAVELVDQRPTAVIAALPEAAPAIAWPALLALAAVLVLRRLPRRAVVAAILPLLLVVVFESGVHGVHHLGDPVGGAECSVAVSAEHVAGAVPDLPAGVAPAPLVSSPLPLADSPCIAGAHHTPGDGRAPPTLSA